MSDERAELADGLWRRLRDVVLVAERIDTFAFRDEVDPERMTLEESDARSLATDFVVRALRAAGDPLNWRILSACASAEEGAAVEDLAVAIGVPRLAVSERVVDLMQSGLVVRALDADRVLATQAGTALAAMVDAVASDLAARLRKARGGTGSNGLPLR